MSLGSELGPHEGLRRELRRERFAAHASESSDSDTPHRSLARKPRALDEPVVGRSCALFRPFFRLRSAPDPSVVRPERMLRASLSALLDEDARPDGGWQAVREQLWSIRQDLHVQHLHGSDLAAEASLEGLRLAVQAGDVAELHRSLAQLVAHGPCASRVRQGPSSIKDEVFSLRLLYLTHGGLQGQPGRLEGELLDFFREQPLRSVPVSSALAYARRVHNARVIGMWTRHLRLAKDNDSNIVFANYHSPTLESSADLSPKANRSALCKQLTQLLVPAVRIQALTELVRAFPHGIAASLASSLLGFGSASDLAAWLRKELLEGVEPIGKPLGSGGRLDCSVMAEYLARQHAAKVSVDIAQHRTKRTLGRAVVTQQSKELHTFAALQAPPKKNVAVKKSHKKLVKNAKKEAKKEKKAAKHEKKKAKKKARKEAKLVRKCAKQASGKAVEPVSSSGSSTSSSSS